MKTIKLTAIKPLRHDTWYLNGDSLAATPFARLIAPEGFNYRIVNGTSYALYHGRDGVQAREIEFQLKPEVSEWHDAILFQQWRFEVQRIHVGWVDYDPADMARFAIAQWDTAPEERENLLRYDFSTSYWERFIYTYPVASPFHAKREGWVMAYYSHERWEKAQALFKQMDALKRELEGVFYGD